MNLPELIHQNPAVFNFFPTATKMNTRQQIYEDYS